MALIIFTYMIDTIKMIIKKFIFCIYYLIWFQKVKNSLQALIDEGTKIIAIIFTNA